MFRRGVSAYASTQAYVSESMTVPAFRSPLAATVILTLIVGSAAWLYVATERSVAGTLGFPIDDAWIHQQFARNIARDGEMAFNRHEPSAGSTAPLWTILIAAPIAVGFDPIVSTKVLGTLLTIVAAVLSWLLAWEIAGSLLAAWVAGLAVALSPRMTWAAVSGMDVPFVADVGGASLVSRAWPPEINLRSNVFDMRTNAPLSSRA